MPKKTLTGLQAVPVCAVVLAGRDADGTLHGPLAAARRAFFEKKRTVRAAGTENTLGVAVKYSGKISRAGLRWKEKSPTGAYGRTFTLRGEDVLLYYDARGKLSRRLVFRGSMWLRSDYFEPEDSTLAVEMLAADPEQEAMLHYTRRPGEETFEKEVLLPVNMPDDAALQSYVNSKLGEPQVLLYGMQGDVMYCAAEEKAQREKMYAAGLPAAVPEEETPLSLSFLWSTLMGEPAPATMPAESPAAEDVFPEEAETAVEEEAMEEPVSAEEPEEPAVEKEEPAAENEETAADPEEKPAEVPEEAKAEETAAEETMMPVEEPAPVVEEVLPAEVPAAEETMLTTPAEADLTFARQGKVYRYVGSLQNGKRHGRGRTEQENGLTAYDGEYTDDKKEGFGSLYYKNGGLCYAGNWKNNRRHGLGVSFRREDNSLHVGKWQDGTRVGMDFLFDKDGRLCVIRDSGDGEEKTVFCIDNSGTVITGLPDAPGNGRGSEFDDDGNMIYTGMHKDGLRHGEGTSFRPDGQIEFTGRWENGVFVEGIAFGPNGAGKYKAIL